MKTSIVIVHLLTCLGHNYSFARTDTTQVEHPPNGHNSPYRIDLVDIISKSQYYDGQQMEVIGYLNLGFEVDALWLSEAAYKAGGRNKSICVNLYKFNIKQAKRFNHHEVVIEGVFHCIDRGLGLTINELAVKSIRRCGHSNNK